MKAHDVDGAFLWDGRKPSPPTRRAARRRGSIKVRSDGREVEQLTVYIEPELAQRLRIAAVTERLDMSTIMAEALESHLAG